MQLVAGCRHSVGIAFVVRPVHFLIVHGFPAFHEFVHLLMNFEAALSLTLQVLKYFFHLSSPPIPGKRQRRNCRWGCSKELKLPAVEPEKKQVNWVQFRRTVVITSRFALDNPARGLL